MRILVAAAFSVLTFGPASFACSCVGSGGCPRLGDKSGPVFLGRVLEVTDLPRTEDDAFLTTRKARISVDEPFGGLPKDAREVDVYTGSGGGDCGIPFKTGEAYLIDAHVGKGGRFHAGICSYTRRAAAARAAIRVLRQRRDGLRIPLLVGQIELYDQNPEAMPLANRLVRIRADRNSYETRSDAEGVYAFYDLPSGQYELAPDMPGTTTRFWNTGERPPISLELKAGTCLERDMVVFVSGPIQGRAQ